ncbi:hypothetical protein BegalDRAFT_3420 [Beggiatoa alba B18LD]|uniref:Uncharacterized protein n=1 Tax=Beggiatoa alba B18LD TaxID=395493 RepID=I3CKU3_9GAMM|nr:hypothetical protein [Beggiatoa alba]EIJ44236.1 hypothetical protein BegalDRAFT_3420 [Beggiatoa alba B18LD]
MKLTVEIASVPDRDSVVAEIWSNDFMLAEIIQCDTGECIIELYPNRHENTGVWEINLDDFIQSLTTAKKRLLG